MAQQANMKGLSRAETQSAEKGKDGLEFRGHIPQFARIRASSYSVMTHACSGQLPRVTALNLPGPRAVWQELPLRLCACALGAVF